MSPGTKRLLYVVLVPVFLLVGALPLWLRFFVLEAFKIPSGSMMPTLFVGDHFFVAKSAYASSAPQRGDVILFRYPESPDQSFLKRVIAIGGDELVIKNAQPVINGWTVPRCSVGKTTLHGSANDTSGELFVEFLGGASYLVFVDDGGMQEQLGPFFAKPGESWVLGDNRLNSHDSPMWFNGQGGGVPRDHVKGKLWFRWRSSAGAPMGTVDVPKLPAESASLQPALDKCLRERPANTTPPPPKAAVSGK